MPDRYANASTANDTRRPDRPAHEDRARPDRPGLLPRRRPAGPHRRPAADQEPRLHRALADARAEERCVRERQRRLPRLLGARLHDRRPAPRHRPGLRRPDGQGARARPQGVPRRRRQSHGRRRAADGNLVHRHPVPRLSREALRAGSLREADVSVPEGVDDAARAVRARGRSHAQEAGVAERPAQLPRPRQHRLRLVQHHLLRAGRLLRARRPVHREARRLERPRADLCVVDHALQGRRLPRRHRQARQRGVLRSLGAEDSRRGAGCRHRPTSRSSAR